MQPKPTKTERKTLVEAFTELPDPRVKERCDHLLHEVLVIALCGILVGGESFYGMEDFASESEGWLRGFLTLPGAVPRHDTFNGAPLGPKGDGSLNLPMRGQKGMVSESGIRVPFVAAWPGKIPGGQVFEHSVIRPSLPPPQSWVSHRIPLTSSSRAFGFTGPNSGQERCGASLTKLWRRALITRRSPAS